MANPIWDSILSTDNMANPANIGIGKPISDAVGSWLGGSHHHKNKGPKPEDYINKIPGQLSPYFQPYADMGKNILPGIQSQFEELMKDPQGFYKRMASGYEESPDFQRRKRQAEVAIANAMGARGMGGSPEHEQFAAQTAADIGSEDFDKYMQSIFGLYGQGLSGLGNLGKFGAESGMRYGEDLASVFGTQGQMAWQREMQKALEKAQREHDIWGGIGQFAGAALPFLATL